MFQTSIQPIKDEIGTVIRDAMTPMQALAMVGLDMVMQSETFARILEIANQFWRAFDASRMLLDPLLPIVQVLSDMVPVLTLGQKWKSSCACDAAIIPNRERSWDCASNVGNWGLECFA